MLKVHFFKHSSVLKVINLISTSHPSWEQGHSLYMLMVLELRPLWEYEGGYWLWALTI